MKLAGLAFGLVSLFEVRAAVFSAVEFASLEGMLKPSEKPFRQELCLNGLWQFQPVALPKGYTRHQGVPPELPPPSAAAWSETPIKIPSHWNVNTWGGGRPGHRPDNQMYWPDSVYYPSYPAEWDQAEMGWLRRSFRVPAAWAGRRIVLRFEAVSGECRVLLNGKDVGGNFDAFLPFEMDVTGHVRRDGDNELMVGIRGQNLFNRKSGRYSKFLCPYPPGSMTDSLVGIWQDVFLLALPDVRVADTYVKPLVSQGMLEAEVVLANDSGQDDVVEISGEVRPWIRPEQAAAAEAKPDHVKAVLSLPGRRVTVKAGRKTTVILRQPVEDQLRFWSPDSPVLHHLDLVIRARGETVDCQSTRFGWRELKIEGSDLLINGEKIQLIGDFVHPFGAYVMSPRYVREWYRMIKDVGGNAVRPHAQIHPRMYLDIADEMGLMVLAETSVFGSSIRLNPEDPAFWRRYEAHYDGMVRRDRNHPGVMGWSFGNEMFAIPRLNEMAEADVELYYNRMIRIGARSLALDPTRAWITCDGDEDLKGTLPVWSKHFGHGDFVDKLPVNLNKPLVVGESGGTYYATPVQLSVFNGDRAYQSYIGRNEALAIDLYENLVRMVLPHLASFSPSEMVWYGLEHQNLGYDDFSRPPELGDGVFFKRPHVEGKPGMQPERIPPYVTTINPGWDPSLPVYKPLPMFEAMKAALDPGGPKPCPWNQRIKPGAAGAALVPATIREVAVAAGAGHSQLRGRLAAWGVPVADGPGRDSGLLVVDAQSLDATMAEDLRARMDHHLEAGGTVLLMVADQNAPLRMINTLLPEPLILTDRKSTMLEPAGGEPWASGLGLKDLYFSGLSGDRHIQKTGMAGPLVEQGRMVLEAANTEWTLFNDVPEKAKAAAVILYERLRKPSGAALVHLRMGKGTLALCSLDYRLEAPAALAMWRRLFGNMGVKLAAADAKGESTSTSEHDLLLNGPLND